MPIALSDSELDIVFAAARPLQVADRDPFLRDVAEALGRLPQIGDGAVHRVVAEVQKRHWDPPARVKLVPVRAATAGAPGTLTISTAALIEAVVQSVNKAFRYSEAEALAQFEAPLIAADVLRCLLAEIGQTERAATLGTIGGLVQHLSHHPLGPSS